MKTYLILILLLSITTLGSTQTFLASDGAKGPWSQQLVLGIKDVPIWEIAAKDNAAMNEKYNEQYGHLNVYAVGEAVDISPLTTGQWIEQPTGHKIWRLSIQSPTAAGFQFIFDQYQLPKGAVLFCYNESGRIYGPYSSAENRADNQLSPGFFYGSKIYLELNLSPELAPSDIKLHLGEIAYGFRHPQSTKSDDPEPPRFDFGSSEECIPHVQCMPWKEKWCDEIRSTVHINARYITSVSDERLWTDISGALVATATPNEPFNPTAGKRYRYKPYILTAKHGVALRYIGSVAFEAVDPELWVVYYNFQSPTCDPVVNGNDLMRSHGLEILGTYGNVNNPIHEFSACPDVALLGLLTPIPFQYNLFFAGYNAAYYPEERGCRKRQPLFLCTFEDKK